MHVFCLPNYCLRNALGLRSVCHRYVPSGNAGNDKSILCFGFFGPIRSDPVSYTHLLLADYKIFGKTAFDLADFFVSNLGLPIGGIIACLLAAWFAWDKVHTHWTSLQNYPGWKKVLRRCV